MEDRTMDPENGPFIGVLEHEDNRGGAAFVLGAWPTIEEAKAAVLEEATTMAGAVDEPPPVLTWSEPRFGQIHAESDNGAASWTIGVGGFWVG